MTATPNRKGSEDRWAAALISKQRSLSLVALADGRRLANFMKHYFANVSFLFTALFCLLPAKLSAKGGGVGFWMEGTVTDVVAVGDHIECRLKGRFWFDQYSDQNPPSFRPQKIEVDCSRGISVTLHQNEPFFAFTADWKGGSLQGNGGLLRILKTAGERIRVIKFELLEPKIVFDAEQTLTLMDAAVIRATDADLR